VNQLRKPINHKIILRCKRKEEEEENSSNLRLEVIKPFAKSISNKSQILMLVKISTQTLILSASLKEKCYISLKVLFLDHQNLYRNTKHKKRKEYEFTKRFIVAQTLLMAWSFDYLSNFLAFIRLQIRTTITTS